MAPHFGWRDVPLAAPLAAHFGIPVYLENDARTLTIAEQWFGAGRGVEHFVTIVVGYGIGAGVVTNGQVYRGAQGGAGEFGHIVLQLDGPRCSCGKRGCLRGAGQELAILREPAGRARGRPAKRVLATSPAPTLEDVAAAADAGDLVRPSARAGRGRPLAGHRHRQPG